MNSQLATYEPTGKDIMSGDRYTFRHAVAMEAVKARTLPAVRWTLAGGMLGTVALGMIAGLNTRNPLGDPTSNVLSGLLIGQLVTVVLGVVAVTGEAGSGQLAGTFCAVPRRGLVLAAKSLVWGLTFLVCGEAAVLIAFFAGTALLRPGVPHPSFLGDPAVARAVLMSGAYLALAGLIGLGVGALIRHGAAAIAVAVGGMYVLPLVIATAGRSAGRFLPELIAGNSLAAVQPVAGFTWSPWLELAIVAAYPAVLLAAGGWLLARRDV